MQVKSGVASVGVHKPFKSHVSRVNTRLISNIALTLLGALLLFDAVSKGILPLPY